MSDADILTNNSLRQELVDDGYDRLPGSGLFDLLAIRSADWAALARRWEDHGPHLHLPDRGRHRRPRHAPLATAPADVKTPPPHTHVPHANLNQHASTRQRPVRPNKK